MFFFTRLIYFLEVFGINTKGVQINEEIRDAEVRLIGENGEQLGIFSAKDAQKIAIDKGLDLVKIAPAANPPVCKIMDYNKFYFEKTKREKESKKEAESDCSQRSSAFSEYRDPRF